MLKVFWLFMLIAFTTLIFLNSSLPMSESGKMSGELADCIYGFCSAAGIDAGSDLEHQLRKAAHFCGFALQGLLLWKVFAAFHVRSYTATGYIFFLGLLTAVVDEYIQSFAYGRNASVNDVLLDFSGIFTMWLACRVWQWSRH